MYYRLHNNYHHPGVTVNDHFNHHQLFNNIYLVGSEFYHCFYYDLNFTQHKWCKSVACLSVYCFLAHDIQRMYFK